MATVTVTAKTDSATLSRARKALRARGISMSAAIDGYLKQIGEPPCSLCTQYGGYAPEVFEQWSRESKKLVRDHRSGKVKAHDDVDALMKDLLSD